MCHHDVYWAMIHGNTGSDSAGLGRSASPSQSRSAIHARARVPARPRACASPARPGLARPATRVGSSWHEDSPRPPPPPSPPAAIIAGGGGGGNGGGCKANVAPQAHFHWQRDATPTTSAVPFRFNLSSCIHLPVISPSPTRAPRTSASAAAACATAARTAAAAAEQAVPPRRVRILKGGVTPPQAVRQAPDGALPAADGPAG